MAETGGGGQTKGDSSGWTTDTLRDHFLSLMLELEKRIEHRFTAQEKAVTSALAASEKAVAVAETNAEKWRQNANEWRGSMDDREKNFASRRDLEAVKEMLLLQTGKGAGIAAVWGWIVGAAGVISAVLVVVLK